MTVSTLTPIVFVVDDDEHVRNALCRVLRSGGFTVQGYGCASAFMEGADLKSAPACLLLDLQLPDFGGLVLLIGALYGVNKVASAWGQREQGPGARS